MIHFESSYNSVKINAIQGESIVNGLRSGNETQSYKVGQMVNSTELSPYRFTNCQITDIYESNGYYYYVIDLGRTSRTFRQKDIILNK